VKILKALLAALDLVLVVFIGQQAWATARAISATRYLDALLGVVVIAFLILVVLKEPSIVRATIAGRDYLDA